jgi:hypothetical protein
MALWVNVVNSEPAFEWNGKPGLGETTSDRSSSDRPSLRSLFDPLDSLPHGLRQELTSIAIAHTIQERLCVMVTSLNVGRRKSFVANRATIQSGDSREGMSFTAASSRNASRSSISAAVKVSSSPSGIGETGDGR